MATATTSWGRETREASAAAELAAERSNMRRLFDHSQMLVVRLEGPSLVHTYVNPVHIAALGEDLTGQPLRRVLSLGISAEVVAGIERVYASGEAVSTGELETHPQQALHVYSVSWVPLTDPLGQVTGVIVLAGDVTEAVRARQRSERLLMRSL